MKSVRLVLMTMACAMAAGALVAEAADATSRDGRRARFEQMILDGVISNPAPQAGGNCGTPTNITSTPYNDTGTTSGATNIIAAAPVSCTGYTRVEGPQVVYSFTAGPGANLTFSVTPGGNPVWDTSIYLVSTCTSGTSCVAGSDYWYAPNNAVPETFSVSSLTAGTTYYLHIDSYYSTSDPAPYSSYSNGPYSLAITGTLPVQLQEFQID